MTTIPIEEKPEVSLRQISVRDLLPDPVPAAKDAPAPRRAASPSIEIVRGVDSSSYSVSHEGAAPAHAAKQGEAKS